MNKSITSLFFVLSSLLFANGPLSFDISANRLEPAIKAFGQQSGINVVVDEELGNTPVRPIHGVFSPQEALALMLEPSGLQFRFTNSESVTINATDVQETMTVSAASRDLAYRATVGATATKTDTLLREIPQAIQVVPTELLAHQEVRRLGGALANVRTCRSAVLSSALMSSSPLEVSCWIIAPTIIAMVGSTQTLWHLLQRCWSALKF